MKKRKTTNVLIYYGQRFEKYIETSLKHLSTNV